MNAHPFLLALAMVGASSSCASSSQAGAPARSTPAVSAQVATDPDQATYQRALALARNPLPENISRSLTAITPDNAALIWRDIGEEPHVLVATFTSSFKYYDGFLGKPYNTGSHDTWVSAAPFVQRLCRDPAWRGADVDRRLIQLLGLPPGGKNIGFASMWVKPADLYRPCPDNEITDTECGLNLPADVDPAYRQWFNDLRARQYFTARDPDWPGWPWTQLGYTFDWHDLGNPVGVSEFLIRRGATVHIEALTPTAEYCAVGGTGPTLPGVVNTTGSKMPGGRR